MSNALHSLLALWLSGAFVSPPPTPDAPSIDPECERLMRPMNIRRLLDDEMTPYGQSSVTFTDNGRAFLDDSRLGDGLEFPPVSHGQGYWTCDAQPGQLSFRASLFYFSHADEGLPTQKLVRIDLAGDWSPDAGLNGEATMRVFPLGADPSSSTPERVTNYVFEDGATILVLGALGGPLPDTRIDPACAPMFSTFLTMNLRDGEPVPDQLGRSFISFYSEGFVSMLTSTQGSGQEFAPSFVLEGTWSCRSWLGGLYWNATLVDASSPSEIKQVKRAVRVELSGRMDPETGITGDATVHVVPLPADPLTDDPVKSMGYTFRGEKIGLGPPPSR